MVSSLVEWWLFQKLFDFQIHSTADYVRRIRKPAIPPSRIRLRKWRRCFAQAVHGNEVEMKIKFGEVEDFHGQFASRRVRGSQPVGFLPDTLVRIVWRFEFARVVQGRLALLREILYD
jgi:hypothetical protein